MNLSEKKATVHDVQLEENHTFDHNEGYNEPPPEQSLHRGLNARQISMIAVSLMISLKTFPR